MYQSEVLAPLAQGQQAYVKALCPLCVCPYMLAYILFQAFCTLKLPIETLVAMAIKMKNIENL